MSLNLESKLRCRGFIQKQNDKHVSFIFWKNLQCHNLLSRFTDLQQEIFDVEQNIPFPSLPSNSSISVTTSSPLVVLTLTNINRAKSLSKPAGEMKKKSHIYVCMYILEPKYIKSTLQIFPPQKVRGIPVLHRVPCNMHVIIMGITCCLKIIIVSHFR